MDRIRTRMAAEDSGFTLIELLIVIVVLGILAGIAILAVDGFKSDATTACTNANDRINKTVAAASSINGSGTYTTANTGSCT